MSRVSCFSDSQCSSLNTLTHCITTLSISVISQTITVDNAQQSFRIQRSKYSIKNQVINNT